MTHEGFPEKGYGSWSAWEERYREAYKLGVSAFGVDNKGVNEPEAYRWRARHPQPFPPHTATRRHSNIAQAIADRAAG